MHDRFAIKVWTHTAARVAIVASLLSVVASASAANERLFAAPEAGSAAKIAAGSSVSQVTVALAIVLALVFVAAWALRYVKKMNLSGATRSLQVVAQVALGAKERAVLVRVNNVEVLVGVAPGQVTALHVFAASEAQAVATAEETPATSSATSVEKTPSFKSLLKQSLGMS